MEHWPQRHRRWLAIGVSSALLALGAGVADRAPVVAILVVISVPFLAAALSGRTIGLVLVAGLLTLLGVVFSFHSELQLLGLIWLAGALVLHWEDSPQVLTRFAAGLIVAVGAWAYAPDGSDAAWLLTAAAVTLLAAGAADEIADHFSQGRELVVRAPNLTFSRYSFAQKLAIVAWACLILTPPAWHLGLPLVVLLLPGAFGAGLVGAVAAFAGEPAEREVRAVTFAVAATPALIIFGAAAWLIWVLSQIEWTVM
jgi:hypothetical protein